jgi:Uma2 family endonuclease
LNWLLGQQIRDGGLRVSVQNLIRLNGRLEPQPDLAVVRVRDYGESLPGPENVLLVIEVSNATLGYDRNVKLALYARAGIHEAWILDLPNNAVERHSDTSEDGYQRMERAGRGRSLASEALPNLTLQTDAVLGDG